VNRLCALLFVLSPSLPVFASTEAKPLTAIAEQIGSAQFTFEQDGNLEAVHGHLAIRAGTLYEPEDKQGIAVLLSRLLADDELQAWLEGRGGSIERTVDIDAIRFAFTCAPSDLEETLSRLSKACQTSEYETAKVASARTKLLRELESEQRTVEGVAELATEQILYGRFGAYSKVSDIGDVGSITAADLKAFHQGQIGANRVTCALVGPVSKASATDAFKKAMTGLGDVGAPAADPMVPIYSPYRTFIYVVDVPDAEHTEIRVVSPGVNRSGIGHSALNSWGWGIAGGPKSRLHKEIVEAGLATSVTCEFESDWNRLGIFRGSMSSPNDKAGLAVEKFMTILQENRGGQVSRAELEEGRLRFGEWEAAQRNDASVRAYRHAQVALQEFPEDYFETHANYTTALNGNYVLRELIRNLFVRRLILVVAGPADQVTESLEYYTDTMPYTLETPSSEPEAAKRVDRMLTALGGAKLWADLKGVELDAETLVDYEGDPRTRHTHLWRMFDSVHFRSEQVNLTEATSVVNGEPGWVDGELGVRTLSPMKYRVQILNTRRWIYSLLHQLALPDSLLSASIDDDDRLVISDRLGEICWLILAENGRPARMGYVDTIDDQNLIFNSWSKSGDYLYCNEFIIPFAYYKTSGDFPQRITKFVPNPVFDAKLYERPKSDS
jgi:predicted Zn-dependent peptidase